MATRSKSGTSLASAANLNAKAKQLADAIFGEPRYTIEEANALGYYSAKQWAQQRKMSSESATLIINAAVAAGKMESIKLAISGGPRAYRVKV